MAAPVATYAVFNSPTDTPRTFITAIGNMHSKGIVPYLKNSNEDYLPDVFTIEFDAYFNPNVYNERYYVTLHDRKNQRRSGI